MRRRGYHQRKHERTNEQGTTFPAGQGSALLMQQKPQVKQEIVSPQVIPIPAVKVEAKPPRQMLSKKAIYRIGSEMYSVDLTKFTFDPVAFKKMCEDSGGVCKDKTCTLRTRSSAGGPLSVVLDFEKHRLDAYFIKTPQPTTYHGDGMGGLVEVKPDESLMKIMDDMTAMEIVPNKYFEGYPYHVDFFAGFQRGAFRANRALLTHEKEGSGIKEPYFRGIGVKPKLPIVQAWMDMMENTETLEHVAAHIQESIIGWDHQWEVYNPQTEKASKKIDLNANDLLRIKDSNVILSRPLKHLTFYHLTKDGFALKVEYLDSKDSEMLYFMPAAPDGQRRDWLYGGVMKE